MAIITSDATTRAVDAAKVDPGIPEALGPANVGRYAPLEEIGLGGMGRVLRAYDPKLQREVALKEVRRSVLDEETSARLEAEARAMAKLSHPNVVAVYDVQEVVAADFDRLVIVMELVDGQTLKAWLRTESPRPWRDLVATFVQAGRGLAAAHAVGLLHRDFKPANVLVTTTPDGRQLVKVADFGLATGVTSSTDSSLGGEELDSASGSRTRADAHAGTPRYMAPEQHAGEELTAAADQFAFCVALWEALHGAPPFTGRDLHGRKRAGAPAWRRASVPKTIVRAIERGLSPRPEQRWSSMDTLLAALDHDPARRRRQWAAALGGVAILGLSASTWRAWDADRAQLCTGAVQQLQGAWDDVRRDEVERAFLGTEQPHAPRVWDDTARDLDHYAESWVAAHTEACAATTLRGEQSIEVMDLRMACLGRAKVELEATSGVLADADHETVTRAHKLVASLPLLDRCGDIEGLRADADPPREEEAEPVSSAREALAEARAELEAGRLERANERIETATETLGDISYAPVRIELSLLRGQVVRRLGKFDDANVSLREALRLALQHHDWRNTKGAANHLLSVAADRQQEMGDALLRYRVLAEQIGTDDDELHAVSLEVIASVLAARGEFEQAEPLHRRALELAAGNLEPSSSRTAAMRTNLAGLLQQRGKYAEAEAEHLRAASDLERVLGPDHPRLGVALSNLAGALHIQGKYVHAEAQLRRAVSILAKAWGDEHPTVATTRDNLGLIYQALGDFAESEATHRRALAVLEQTYGVSHPAVARSHNNLATTLHRQGRLLEAEAELRRALAGWSAALGDEHPHVAQAHHNLGLILFDQGKYEDAESELRRGLILRQDVLNADHPEIAKSQHHVAATLAAQNQVRPALELVEKAWSRRQRDDISSQYRGETAFLTAQLRWKVGDLDAAREVAKEAIRAYEAAGNRDAVNAARAWLNAL